MRLYKYTEKKYLNSFFNYGKLRIGTLYEYQDIEKHGNSIGDDEEGKKHIFNIIENEIYNKNDTLPSLINRRFKISANNVTFKNVKVTETINSENLYIFSVTEKFDKIAMEGFKYNACYIINDPNSFFRAISRIIRYKAEFIGVYKCQYQNRNIKIEEDLANSIHPALLKDEKYSYQNEYRAIWRSKKTNKIKPLIIKCKKAIKCCSKYNI